MCNKCYSFGHLEEECTTREKGLHKEKKGASNRRHKKTTGRERGVRALTHNRIEERLRSGHIAFAQNRGIRRQRQAKTGTSTQTSKTTTVSGGTQPRTTRGYTSETNPIELLLNLKERDLACVKSKYRKASRRASKRGEDHQGEMMIKNRARRNVECFNCGKKGHFARDSWSKKKAAEGNSASASHQNKDSEDEWERQMKRATRSKYLNHLLGRFVIRIVKKTMKRRTGSISSTPCGRGKTTGSKLDQARSDRKNGEIKSERLSSGPGPLSWWSFVELERDR